MIKMDLDYVICLSSHLLVSILVYTVNKTLGHRTPKLIADMKVNDQVAGTFYQLPPTW